MAAGKQPQQINVGQRRTQGTADDLHAVAGQVVVAGNPTLRGRAQRAGAGVVANQPTFREFDAGGVNHVLPVPQQRRIGVGVKQFQP